MRNNTMTIKLLDVLTEKREENAPLINIVERNCQDNVKADGNSIRLKDRSSGTYLFSAEDWGSLELQMDEVYDELDTFMVNDRKLLGNLQETFPGAVIGEYDSYIMDKADYIPAGPMGDGVEAVPLDLSWLEFILAHYKDKEFGNERYLSDRIRNGPGLGLIFRGHRAAFVLQHKDGESGPLVVDAEYRGMGLGCELLKRFNGLLFEKNSILYGFVSPANIASAHMMVGSGYRKASNRVLWIYRMKNGSIYLP